MKGLNFTIEDGQKVAIVGESGSGKSTCVQLIERFYNTTKGHIFLNNVDLNSYNLK